MSDTFGLTWWFICEGCLRPTSARPHWCEDCDEDQRLCEECFEAHLRRDHTPTVELPRGPRAKRSSGFLRIGRPASREWDDEETEPDGGPEILPEIAEPKEPSDIEPED